MAYKIIARCGDAYAIQDTSTGEMEALPNKYIEIGLIMGLSVEGATLDDNCNVQYDLGIRDFNFDEEEPEEEYYEEEEPEEEYEMEYEEEEPEEEYYEEEEPEEEYEMEYEEEEPEVEYEEEEPEEEYEMEYEEEYEEESTVGNLYSYLSDDQIRVLKRYYLWFSQRIFSEAQKDPTLGMKDINRLRAKQKDLASLRNLGGMWHYAGFIDTGYDGGGECTLGHKLRYMHLAWDVTVSDIESAFFGDMYNAEFEEVIESNNCIVFGIKCVSDFFEVGKECTRALQKAQRDSLKDMDEMCTQYEDGTVNDVVASFGVMDELMKKVKRIDSRGIITVGEDYKPILPPSMTAFYFQFRELNMPIPRSLIYEIRCKLLGWETYAFYGSMKVPTPTFKNNMSRILGKKYTVITDMLDYDRSFTDYLSVDYKSMLKCFIMVWYTYEICGYFKYNGENNRFEGGRSKRVKAKFNNLYTSLKRRFWSDAEFTEQFMEKLLIFSDLYFNKLEPLENNLNIEIHYYGDAMKLYNELMELKSVFLNYSIRPCNESYSITRSIDVGISELSSALERYEVVIQEYRDICEREKKKEESEKVQEKEVEEVKEEPMGVSAEESKGVSIEDANNFLKTYDLKSVSDSKFDFNKRIVESTILNGREPSYKQQYYVNKLYEHITGNKVQKLESKEGKEKEYLSDHSEYAKAIDYALSSDCEDIVKAICKSVKKYGTFTEKQKKYLDKALNLYRESLNT